MPTSPQIRAVNGVPPEAGNVEQLPDLVDRVERLQGFGDVLARLSSGGVASVGGVWGAGCALAAVALARHAPGPVVVVRPHLSAVDALADDVALLSDRELQRFPAWESEPGEQVVHDEIHAERLRVIKRLAAGRPPALIATNIQSLLQPVPTPAYLAEQTRLLEAGETVDPEGLARWLSQHGFHGTPAVELPGEFSIRGGIVDVFAPEWRAPVRIEFFGDQVESLRTFDVQSQRSRQALQRIDMTLIEPVCRETTHLMDYIPDTSWVMLEEPRMLYDEGQTYLERLDETGAFYGVQETFRRAGRFPCAHADSLAQAAGDAVCNLPIESVERFSGEIGRVRSELDAIGEGHNVFLVCATEAETQRLGEILASSRLSAEGRLAFARGRLSQGFRYVTEQTVVLSGAELFQRSELVRTSRRHVGRSIDSFLALREGDLVVHLAHGIGRYRGMVLLEGKQQAEEHLELEFHGGTKIYVPASKIDLVQKYVGGTRSRPALARIGGRAWGRQKAAAEKAALDLATEMIEVEATRAARPGLQFPDDSDWQTEFDASFPYAETTDQLEAIRAIKADMQTPRPMDRLLCGDVGFGKTELAVRAAFKAVDAGYQVAVLVPTTILAEQHRRTFGDRMSEFPVQIATLSRFCTRRRQSEIVESLANGAIDVVIGTHRLAGSDVRFHNLGLVIIDEEQRFGVEIKERLKSYRKMVDVLTMTATPIPRTLHLALLGVRSISNLETPPDDRYAVETRVIRWSDDMIRHAVLRELNRDGQIFFVHNRVQDIDAVAHRLKRIVPEARIEIGHGQMPEHQLEEVMLGFIDRRFDLLLSTTIVESGLDIANANTIFVDEADRYGLADLHQLRGRVGRYKHRAYCYLMIDQAKHISPDAARRLRAIEEFSEMGAGFAIATRDLELRGAGNILGTQQSGHISNVGYELYCTLLDRAVRTLRRLPLEEAVDVHVDLPGRAYLPPQYVPDQRTKIDLYRRVSRLTSEEKLADLVEELQDRFGPLPEPAERLVVAARLRIRAHRAGIASLHLEDRYVVVRTVSPAALRELAGRGKKRLRIVDERTAYLPLDPAQQRDRSAWQRVESLLRPR